VAAAEPLPFFKYHPDPAGTCSIVADNDTPCLRCSRIRGFIYVGPKYSEKFHYLSHSLCPWCIADGSARQFGAEFTDVGMMDGVPAAVIDEVGRRTPGFESWQQDHWLTCCGDAAAYLGAAGAAELKRNFPEAIPAVKDNLREDYELSGKELQEFFDALSKDNMPTAYIFRCLHCSNYLAYVDETLHGSGALT